MSRRSGGASIASYRVGGKVYPYRTVHSCLTCQSPHRLEIEEHIARGVPYSRIENDLNLRDPKNRVHSKSMARHFNGGHMPVQEESIRRIIERRATERGQSIEDGIASIVDGVGFAEMVLQKAVDRMADGTLAPSIQDGLQAAKLLETLGPVIEGGDEQDYLVAFTVYHSIAQAIMTPSQFEDFGRRLSTNPTLKALMSKYEGEGESVVVDDEDDFYSQGQLVPGEVVHDPS